MDNADRAQELIDQRLEDALAARRAASAQAVQAQCTDCEDCGEDIPAARRKRLPGVVTCVACQTRREGRR